MLNGDILRLAGQLRALGRKGWRALVPPHQGAREMARRRRQFAHGQLTGLFGALALLVLAGCSSSGGLTPAGAKLAGAKLAAVGCAVDSLAQPIALPFISGLPTVGGVAASVDAALVHPLVVQACTSLAASLGTGPAKPVVLP